MHLVLMDNWVLRDRLQSSMPNSDPEKHKSAEKLPVEAKITQVKNKTQQNANSIARVKVTMSDLWWRRAQRC